MTLIRNIQAKEGVVVSGWFRVKSCNPSGRGGGESVEMTLVDRSGILEAYGVLGRYQGPITFTPYQVIWAVGQLHEVEGGIVLDLISCSTETPQTQGVSTRVLPYDMCPYPEMLDSLDDLVGQIETKALRDFVEAVFWDEEVAYPFLSAPASLGHHHDYSGGLLQHSIECAWAVMRFNEIPKNLLELAMVAALFHDVGKTRTLAAEMKRTLIGHVLDHDDLTLEILASHLLTLDQQWPDGGLALRHLLTCRSLNGKSRKPQLMAACELVSMADRMSCAAYSEKKAFWECPDWKRFSKVEEGVFWRPRESGD